ncbi:MAG: glycosyltransferase [Actinomycetota bacterium]|nr:glycosyltransferase [Actinomycetota bacterium]
MLSAAVFESAFASVLAPVASTRTEPADRFLEAVLGPLGAPMAPSLAARALAAATEGIDVLFPSYAAGTRVAELVNARNLAGLALRIFVRAHSPGASPLEWALLAPLLATGDQILCPSESAAALLATYDPGLSRFVSVLPPPVAPPEPAPPTPRNGRRGLLSLCRLDPTKLMHRVLDALALLRHELGEPDLSLAVAAALDATGTPLPAARALMARAERLDIVPALTWLGPLGSEKWAHLASSALLVNCSVSLEESFGMAPLEAAALGVPVVATAWDGLVETVGAAGRCVGVHAPLGRLASDVEPRALAEAIAATLADPPDAATCHMEAAKAAPERLRQHFGELLGAAGESRGVGASAADLAWAPAAAPGGLLARSLPLAGLDYHALYEALCGAGDPRLGRLLRDAVPAAVAVPVSRLFAGLPPAPGDEPLMAAPSAPVEPFASIGSPAVTLSSSIALAAVLAATDAEAESALDAGLLRLAGTGLAGVRVARMLAAARRGASAVALEDATVLACHAAGTCAKGCGHDLAPSGEAWGATLATCLAASRRSGGAPEVQAAAQRWLDAHPDGPDAADVVAALAAAMLADDRFDLSGAAVLIGRLEVLEGSRARALALGAAHLARLRSGARAR